MHDSSEDEAMRLRNRTVQMTLELVPALKQKGYRFAALASAPRVRDAMEHARCRQGRSNGDR